MLLFIFSLISINCQVLHYSEKYNLYFIKEDEEVQTNDSSKSSLDEEQINAYFNKKVEENKEKNSKRNKDPFVATMVERYNKLHAQQDSSSSTDNHEGEKNDDDWSD